MSPAAAVSRANCIQIIAVAPLDGGKQGDVLAGHGPRATRGRGWARGRPGPAMAYPAGHGRARAPGQLNLEFDGKREPVTRCLELVDGAAHLSFDTVPWRTPEQGQRARALCDGCGAKNCLQTAPLVLSRPPANPGLGCADRRRGGGGYCGRRSCAPTSRAAGARARPLSTPVSPSG